MTRIRLFVALSVVVVLAVSCGGGDESASQPTEPGVQEPSVTLPAESVTQSESDTAAVWVPLGDRFGWCTDLQSAWERHGVALLAAVTAVTGVTLAAAAASDATDELDRAAAAERLNATKLDARDVIRVYDATASDYPRGRGVDFLAALSQIGDTNRDNGTKGVAYGRASDAFAAAASPEETALLRHFGEFVFLGDPDDVLGVSAPAAVVASVAVVDAFDAARSGFFIFDADDVLDDVIAIRLTLHAARDASAETLSAAPGGSNLSAVPEFIFADAIDGVNRFGKSAVDTVEDMTFPLQWVYELLANGDDAAAAAEVDAVMDDFDALEAELTAVVVSIEDIFDNFAEIGYGYIRFPEGDENYGRAADVIDVAAVEVAASRAGFDAAVEVAFDDIAQRRAAFLSAVDDAHAAVAAPYDAAEEARRVAATAGLPAWTAATEALAIEIHETNSSLIYPLLDFVAETAAVESLMHSPAWPALQTSLADSCA